MKTFDVMVIGSGSGLEVSSEAAERGLHALDVISNPRQRASYERQFKKVLQRFEQPAVVPVAGRVRAPR